jgi:hypothetical protein
VAAKRPGSRRYLGRSTRVDDILIAVAITTVFLAAALFRPTLDRFVLSPIMLGGELLNLLYTLPNTPCSLVHLVAKARRWGTGPSGLARCLANEVRLPALGSTALIAPRAVGRTVLLRLSVPSGGVTGRRLQATR